MFLTLSTLNHFLHKMKPKWWFLYTVIGIWLSVLLLSLTYSFWAYLGLFFFFEGDKQVSVPQIENVVIPLGVPQVQWEKLKNCPVVLQLLNILLHKLASVAHIGARRKLITTFARVYNILCMYIYIYYVYDVCIKCKKKPHKRKVITYTIEKHWLAQNWSVTHILLPCDSWW